MVLGWDVFDCDGAFLKVVVQIVMLDIDELSFLRWGGVLCSLRFVWLLGCRHEALWARCCRTRRSHAVCCTAVVAAMYSASHVESAITLCLLDDQLTGEQPSVCTIPE